MAKLGMINTYWALILPSVAGTLGLFLMRNFMVSLPFSLIESANIDGAGLFRIFWQIVMPNVKPAWLTLLIFTFQGLWNGAGSRFIYTESLKVLPTILGQISSAGIARAGVGSAVAVVMMIPPIITFLLVESNVLETMAHSGIKD
jgi:ABC-type glycerol-3-phosphate transport system permease component